ncbi:MAG: SDR family oxidoreductase [Ottowia sp.]|nr:SDR family oxidoreductase [Ottowia sp.]
MTPRKVVLVTGSAKRIGRALAEYFGKNDCDVIVHYNLSQRDAQHTVENIKRIGCAAVAVQANLKNSDDIKRIISFAYDYFGRLDVLVNSASVFDQDHFKDFSLESFDDSWQVNCRAPILLTKAFYEKARANEQTGVVINIVDQKVRDNFQPDHFCYTVGKTGIGYLTKMLAISAMPVLRVNAVYPGLLLPSGGQTQADFVFAQSQTTPLGYTATPDNIAEAVYHLTSPPYNGVDLVVDAGQNLIRVDQDVIFKYKIAEEAL